MLSDGAPVPGRRHDHAIVDYGELGQRHDARWLYWLLADAVALGDGFPRAGLPERHVGRVRAVALVAVLLSRYPVEAQRRAPELGAVVRGPPGESEDSGADSVDTAVPLSTQSHGTAESGNSLQLDGLHVRGREQQPLSVALGVLFRLQLRAEKVTFQGVVNGGMRVRHGLPATLTKTPLT